MRLTRFALYALVATMMMACTKADHLVILHTNDTHSQVLPNGKGLGGYARRMGLIAEARAEEPNLLLVDAGDFSQGTPYFNYFRGRVEVDALNRMGYDVVTLGNHEFDNGLDTLAAVLRGAKFDVVCANYDVTGTPLEGIVKPYTIIRRGGRKIGVFGIGVNPYSLIAEKNFAPIKYLEPYATAQRMADVLRDKGCDVVVCLSHQGTYATSEGAYNDADMCAATRGIDVIIGGHTHKVFPAERICNADGEEISVVQMGKAGANLGRIVLSLLQE